MSIWQRVCVCVYVSLCVWSVALTQVRACRGHMLFHLSHFEMLLLDELLISQNQTHEATHIIIGEAAVDGVIYCRVSCACVGEKDAMYTSVHLNWFIARQRSMHGAVVRFTFSFCLVFFLSCLCSHLPHLPNRFTLSYLFVCLRSFLPDITPKSFSSLSL